MSADNPPLHYLLELTNLNVVKWLTSTPNRYILVERSLKQIAARSFISTHTLSEKPGLAVG